VVEVARTIATTRGVSFDEIANATAANALQLFWNTHP
jgi:Tat protein secretion system quality control protein TatD with DNase activity